MALRVWNQIPGIKLLQNGYITSLKGERRTRPRSQSCSASENDLTLQTNDPTKPQSFSELPTKSETNISDGVKPMQENLQNDSYHCQEMGVNEIKKPLKKIDNMDLYTKEPMTVVEKTKKQEEENSPRSSATVIESDQTTNSNSCTHTLECANLKSESKLNNKFEALRKIHFDKIYYGVDTNNLQPKHAQPFYHNNEKAKSRNYLTYTSDKRNMDILKEQNVTDKYPVNDVVSSSSDLKQSCLDAPNTILTPSSSSDLKQSCLDAPKNILTPLPNFGKDAITDGNLLSDLKPISQFIKNTNITKIEQSTKNKKHYNEQEMGINAIRRPISKIDRMGLHTNVIIGKFKQDISRKSSAAVTQSEQTTKPKSGATYTLACANLKSESKLQDDFELLKKTHINKYDTDKNNLQPKHSKPFYIYNEKMESRRYSTYSSGSGNIEILNLNNEQRITNKYSLHKIVNSLPDLKQTHLDIPNNILSPNFMFTPTLPKTIIEMTSLRQEEISQMQSTPTPNPKPTPTLTPTSIPTTKMQSDQATHSLDKHTYTLKCADLKPRPKIKKELFRKHFDKKCIGKHYLQPRNFKPYFTRNYSTSNRNCGKVGILNLNNEQKITNTIVNSSSDLNQTRLDAGNHLFSTLSNFKNPDMGHFNEKLLSGLKCNPQYIKKEKMAQHLIDNKQNNWSSAFHNNGIAITRNLLTSQNNRNFLKISNNKNTLKFGYFVQLADLQSMKRIDMEVVFKNEGSKNLQEGLKQSPFTLKRNRILSRKYIKSLKNIFRTQLDSYTTVCRSPTYQLINNIKSPVFTVNSSRFHTAAKNGKSRKLKFNKSLNKNIFTSTTLRTQDTTKDVNAWDKRLCPQERERQDAKTCDFECIEPQIPTILPKLKRLVKRYDDYAIVEPYETRKECIPPCPKPRADDDKDFYEKKCLPVLECNDCPKICQDNKCSVPLRRLKPRIVYRDPERVCPPPCLKPDPNLMQLIKPKTLPPIPEGDCYECLDNRPTCDPKLKRLVKRYDDNAIVIDYKTIPKCIPPCPKPRADDDKDFYEQKCLPVLECNDCPKICNDDRCSVPLRRLTPRIIYKDPERVCPPPCIKPEVNLEQVIKKKTLPPIPEGDCYECIDDRPTCDPKLKRLVKRYDVNTFVVDYKTIPECIPPCPKPRADDNKDFYEQKCLPVLECNDCPKICQDDRCSVPLRRLKPRIVYRDPERVCPPPCLKPDVTLKQLIKQKTLPPIPEGDCYECLDNRPTCDPKLQRLVKRYDDNAIVIDYKTIPKCIPPCPKPRADDDKDFYEQKCLPVLECNDCPKICNDDRCSVPLRRLTPRIIYEDPERVCPPPCIKPEVNLEQVIKKKTLPPIPEGDCYECIDDRPTCDPKLKRLVKRYDVNTFVVDYKTKPECIPPCPKPRADDNKDFYEQKCLPVLECNDCPKVCNDDRCSVPLRRLKPRVVYRDPERVCPPPCLKPDVTLKQLITPKTLPPIPEGDCYECLDDRPTCDPKLKRLVKRYDDNAIVIDYKTIPKCIPPCPKPRADDDKVFDEQKCLPVLECNDCPKICYDDRCSVPLRRLQKRYDTNIETVYPPAICDPPCGPFADDVCQYEKKRELKPMLPCNPKLKGKPHMKNYFSKNKSRNRHYSTYRRSSIHTFNLDKYGETRKLNLDKSLNRNIFTSTTLHTTKDVNTWDERLCPQERERQDHKSCDFECVEPEVPSLLPKLKRLVKRYDDYAITVPYETKKECIPPCPKPRADDNKDFYEQKCLPVLECNDCPKICHDNRCSVPLRRLKPRMVYRDPERVCPPPCVKPDVNLKQLIKKKILPRIPEGDCYECLDNRPTCDPKLKRLVKRYDDNAIVIDYRTKPECIPPCPKPRADDKNDFYTQKCLPVLECNDCPKICKDDRCSVPLRRLKKRYDTNTETVYPAIICDPPCGPLADDVCQFEKKRELKPMLPCNPKLKNKPHMKNYFSKNKLHNRHYSTYRKTRCCKCKCRCDPCPSCKVPAKKQGCPSKVAPNSLVEKIVQYFKARPNCPHPDAYKKEILERKAAEAAKAVGKELCVKQKYNCKRFSTFTNQKALLSLPINNNNKCIHFDTLRLSMDNNMIRSVCPDKFFKNSFGSCEKLYASNYLLNNSLNINKTNNFWAPVRYYSSSKNKRGQLLGYFQNTADECEQQELVNKILEAIRENVQFTENDPLGNINDTYQALFKDLSELSNNEFESICNLAASNPIQITYNNKFTLIPATIHEENLEKKTIEAIKSFCRTARFLQGLSYQEYEAIEREKTQKVVRALDNLLEQSRNSGK